MFAVSYDPVVVLAGFAEKYGIGYPLLSDEGSRVIRELGLLNEHVAEQHAAFGVTMRDEHYNTPYPGTFVLDQAGTMVEKWFEQSYRARPSPESFLEASFGVRDEAGTVRSVTENEHLRVDVSLGSPIYRPHEKLRLNIEIQIAAGLHVYGEPVSPDYVPLSVTIDPVEALDVDPLQLPAARPFTIEGLDEQFQVYQGRIRAVLPFLIAKHLGDVTLTVRVGYQACTEALCYLPAELTLQIPLEGRGLIRD